MGGLDELNNQCTKIILSLSSGQDPAVNRHNPCCLSSFLPNKRHGKEIPTGSNIQHDNSLPDLTHCFYSSMWWLSASTLCAGNTRHTEPCDDISTPTWLIIQEAFTVQSPCKLHIIWPSHLTFCALYHELLACAAGQGEYPKDLQIHLHHPNQQGSEMKLKIVPFLPGKNKMYHLN